MPITLPPPYNNAPIRPADVTQTMIDLYNVVAQINAGLSPVPANLSGPGGAALIGTTPSGGITSTNVQASLNELDSKKVPFVTLAAAGGATLVGNTPAGAIAATTVQAALNELDTEKTSVAALAASGGAALVGNNPSGNISATNVQAALNELDTEKVSLVQLSSSSGSSLVGNIAVGTGAASRTVQDELRDTLSVTQFTGVDKTGVGNSTTGFQNCINAAAASGKYVRIPAGTYLIGALTFPSGIKGLVGDSMGSVRLNISGAITAFSPILFFNGVSDFYVGGLTIDANIVTYAQNHGMQFGACSKGIVEDIHFIGGGYISIYAPTCSNVTFQNITADTYAVSLFLADTSPSLLVLNNLRGLAAGTGHGIGIQGGNRHRISGCYSPGAGASFFSISLFQVSESIVENCVAVGTTREAIQLTDGNRNKIRGNLVICGVGHTDFGISIFSAGVDIFGNEVTGNTVYLSGGSGIGVSASFTPSVQICQLNKISDNIIISPNQINTAEGSGVLLLGGATCTGNIVENNTCFDQSNKMRYGANEWNSGGNPNNNKLINNPCFGGAVFISEGNVVGVLSGVWDLDWQSFATTVTSQTGTITTVNTSLTYFKYKRRGSEIEISARAAITTNGTGASSVQMSMPFTMVGGILAGRENGVSGAMLQGYSGGANLLRIATFTPAYPGANGAQCVMSGIVET